MTPEEGEVFEGIKIVSEAKRIKESINNCQLMDKMRRPREDFTSNIHSGQV
jgi:hypothetical protein